MFMLHIMICVTATNIVKISIHYVHVKYGIVLGLQNNQLIIEGILI